MAARGQPPPLTARGGAGAVLHEEDEAGQAEVRDRRGPGEDHGGAQSALRVGGAHPASDARVGPEAKIVRSQLLGLAEENSKQPINVIDRNYLFYLDMIFMIL